MSQTNEVPRETGPNSCRGDWRKVPAQGVIGDVLAGIAALPEVLRLAEAQSRTIEAMRKDIEALRSSAHGTAVDGWLDAKGAAAYLSMSAGTFDKYRYEGSPRIKGYRIGGKLLYKREDLDSFVKLWEMKSTGA